MSRLIGDQYLWDYGDCGPGRRVANPGMRRHRRSPAMKRKVGQRHLGQYQDDGEQGQLKKKKNQLPALHGTNLTQSKNYSSPMPGCQ